MGAAPLTCVAELAADVGRLRRQSPGWLPDRIACRVEQLAVLLAPTAADLYQANMLVCGDPDVSVEDALERTHREAARVRELLAEERRAA